MAKARAKDKPQSLTNNAAPARPVVRIADPTTMPDQYIVKCDGVCMLPNIADGSPVLCDKTQPVKAGDLVVLFFKPEHIPNGEHQAILKRLVLNVPPYVKFPFKEHPDSNVHAIVIVEMDNPPKQFGYKCEHLLGIHKCLGPLPADAVYHEATKTWEVPSLAKPSGAPLRRPRGVKRP